jgi:DNA polymerase-3 subunit delta'
MTFAEIEGHARVIELLRRAVARDRLPHAYLFAGPEGVGKCTTAQALAARLLCETAADDACGRCEGCRGAERETHPDFVVMRLAERAQELKIDQVRDLQRILRLKPLRARRKVAIVDGADRLNLAAQNALLKTLEEPPGAALLVLVAANADALVPTVVSRCQRLSFAPLPTEAVERLLVARGGLSAAEARALAPYGDGSAGQALLLRAEVIDRARTQLLPLLADLAPRPFADLADLAQEWGRLELGDLLLLLRAPLGWYRQRLGEAVAAGADPAAVRRVLRQLRVVYDTIERLRRNAHRQIVLDAMLLGLQAAGRDTARRNGP